MENRDKVMETRAVNAIRVLSADAIQKAKSGHPGLPLGAAAMGFELWAHHMKFNPVDLEWEDRDRFVLSAGHGSMLLYALMNLFGWNLGIEDIRQFRQLDSETPGHPEYRNPLGVEATTGPLGAGIAMGVGMAAAEAHLAAVFNKPDYKIVDHRTYVLCGDGCMMEGISSEAMSLAGTWKLDKLTLLYDANRITIEGSIDGVFTEDVGKRAEAFGFKVLDVPDGNDLEAIGRALDAAKADESAPYFIIVHTEIGYGCPAKQGTAKSHGEPLGEENVRALKEFLGWPQDKDFYVPQDIYEYCGSVIRERAGAMEEWRDLFSAYRKAYPEMAELWDKYHSYDEALSLLKEADNATPSEKADATRSYSGKVLNKLKDRFPNLMGGSADLAPSVKTEMTGEAYFGKECPEGRNVRFGVREMAMTGIANGLLLHGGIRSFVSTFFVFSDYLKPMARLAAIMRLPQILVLSHDSIGVGEDGPTHEPVEHLCTLRSIPNFRVFRPAGRAEVEAAWYAAMASRETPTALILTRQKVDPVPDDGKKALRGAYVIRESKGTPEYILIATGSEVALALKAQARLEDEGFRVRVVSMPCMELFEDQSEEYKESVLPSSIRKRVAIEALSGFGWERYTGLDGAVISINRFGKSAPADVLFSYFGFTVDHVIDVLKRL